MSDLTNALIAAKLMGNGGGGGGGGLPPITPETVIVFPESTISGFTNMGGLYAASIDMEQFEGQAVVSFDGTDYQTQAHLNEGNFLCGNMYYMGIGEDTGEPFLIASRAGRMMIATPLTGGSHTVKVAAIQPSVSNGSVIMAIDGEWKTQSGYGYEGGVAVTHIKKELLPRMIRTVELTLGSQDSCPAGAMYSVSFEREFDGIPLTSDELYVVLTLRIYANGHYLPLAPAGGYMSGDETSDNSVAVINPTSSAIVLDPSYTFYADVMYVPV